MSEDLEAALAEALALIDTIGADAGERAEQAASLLEAVEGLKAAAASPGGEVWLEVGSSGVIEKIEFFDRALARTPMALAQAVLKAQAKAHRSLREAANQLVAESVDPASPTALAVLETYSTWGLGPDQDEAAEASAAGSGA